MEDETDRLLMSRFGAFKRRVVPNYIIPSKSGWLEERHGVSIKDDSPEGLYPSMVVPGYNYDKIMVILPEEEFNELFKSWKKANPKIVKNCDKITQEEKHRKAISNLRFLFKMEKKENEKEI